MMLQAHPMLVAAFRLGLAFLLALPVGWEQEHRSRSVGLRTYPLLAVCVCSFLLLGQHFARDPAAQADVFFGLLTGIGFVGTGAILKSEDSVRGMSTAVSLWVTGAIGAGVAYGGALLSAAVSLICGFALWLPVFANGRGSAS